MDLFPHRNVWRLALPLILSNVTVALLGIVDTAVVGHLDEPTYLGGVAVGGTLFNVLYWAFGFLRMGTSGVTAQRYGAEDGNGLRAVLGQAVFLALAFGALVVVLQRPIGTVAFHLIGASPAVTGEAETYFAIRVWSAPATFLGYALLGWFLGVHNARAQLAYMLCVNSINIVLDLVFVLVLEWGVAGVAWASVIAEFSGALLAALLIHKELARHPGIWQRERLLAWHELSNLLALNRDIFLRTLCLVFAFAFFNAQSARMGDTLLAVNAVLMNFLLLTAYAMDGIAYAAEALVGSAVGRGDRLELRATINSVGLWSGALAALFTLTYLVAGIDLVRMMTDLPEVVEAARYYLPWAIVLPLVAGWCFFLDGVFVGATRAREMRDTMIFSVVLVYLPAWWLTRGLGNQGLWLAFTLYMGARGASMALVLRHLWRTGRLLVVSKRVGAVAAP